MNMMSVTCFTQTLGHICTPCTQGGALSLSCPVQNKTLITCYVAPRPKTKLFVWIQADQGAVRGRLQGGTLPNWGVNNTKGEKS